MLFLEIMMLVIGLGAVIFSFYVSDKKDHRAKESETLDTVSHQSTMDEVEKLIEELEEKSERISENVDEKLSTLSNEKILGMNEYSDQVIDKIEKNHAEVVFLYDMLNEKQEEIKKLVNEIDELKADIHDEAAKGYQSIKEQEEKLDTLKKEMELDYLKMEKLSTESVNEAVVQNEDVQEIDKNQPDSAGVDAFDELLSGFGEIKDSASEGSDVTTASVFDDEIARIEEEEAKNMSQEKYRPLKEQQEMDNHNDEIIALYKKGRSVLDISKMLSLGQGEVKFVIDLYRANA